MVSYELVIVTLEQLQNGVDSETLKKAFGPDSLGIIVVKDLPAQFTRLRMDVLQSATVLAKSPENELEKLESEESTWLVGWSRGKEKFPNTGLPDNLKGSYYVNCAFHKDAALEGPSPETIVNFGDDKYKCYTTKNLWPDETQEAKLKGFQENIKLLCSLIIDVAGVVAANCDRYITKRIDGYEPGYLERVVKNSTTTKARLLHYYPTESALEGDDSWCGEHLDHSCLTGLTSALFLDESKSNQGEILDRSPDPDAGLYIRSRNGQVIKVNIPSNCLAFQSGSCLEEVSRGGFKAVPHYVKGTSIPSIARNTLAVFCQPDLHEPVSQTENFAQYANRILNMNHTS